MTVLAAVLAVAPAASGSAASEPGGDAVSFEIVDVAGQIDSISPDGRWLAGMDGRTPCIWLLDTLEPVCADAELPVIVGLSYPVMTWAPDSSAVAFTEDFLRRLEEPDVYVLTTDGELTNLTDDGVEGGILTTDDATPLIDLAPSWSRDSSTVYFARSVRDGSDDGNEYTQLMAIPRTGGEPIAIAAPLAGAMLVWQPLHEATDGSLLVAAHHPQPRVANGILRLPVGADTLHIVRLDDERGERGLWMPMISSVTPAGDTAFVYNPQMLAMYPTGAPSPTFWKLDVATGRATPANWLDLGDVGSAVGAPADPPQPGDVSTLAFPMGPQAFSPDGSRWVGLFQRVDFSDRLLVLVDTASGEVLATLDESATDDRRFWPYDPQFATDGTVMISAGGGTALLIDFGDR